MLQKRPITIGFRNSTDIEDQRNASLTKTIFFVKHLTKFNEPPTAY
jgi:hypothetical protein